MKRFVDLVFSGALVMACVMASPGGYTRLRDVDFDRGYVLHRVVSGEDVSGFFYDNGGLATWTSGNSVLICGGVTASETLPLYQEFGTPFPHGELYCSYARVFADGTLWFEDRIPLEPPLGGLSLVPMHKWGDLPASWYSDHPGLDISGPFSLVWYGWTLDEPSVFRISWDGALLGRDMSVPVRYQVALHRNGDFDMHFDLSRVPDGHPVLSRLWLAFGTERPTTVEWHRISPDDRDNPNRDGDGIDAEREILDYGSNPGSNDTDGDSLYDLAELLYGTSPLSADTDGDGYGDATDPDPLAPTSWDDADGDRLPDAWVARWFKGVAPDPYADQSGDGVCNIAALHMGVRPDTSWFLGTQAYSGLLPPTARAYKFMPAAFSAGAVRGGVDQLVEYTNWVDRAFPVERVSPWQQLFVVSSLDGPSFWYADGLSLSWEAGGESGEIPSYSNAPYRIPVSHTNAFSSIRLVARAYLWSGATVSLGSPLFLVVCAPQVDVGSDDFYARRVDLPGDPVYTVCNRMDGSGYWLPCTVVRGWDPYQAHYRGIPYADYYRDDDLEAALAMPPMAGVEFRDGHLVWQDAGSSYLPWQGTRPRVMVIRHYMPWSY